MHFQASGGEKGYNLHAHTRLPLVLNLSFDVQKSYKDAGMPGKVSPALAFLRSVNSVNPASALQHHSQSDTAGHGLVRHCPAMLFSCKQISYFVALGLSKPFLPPLF